MAHFNQPVRQLTRGLAVRVAAPGGVGLANLPDPPAALLQLNSGVKAHVLDAGAVRVEAADRLGLLDQAIALAGYIAGRDVQELRADPLGQGAQVLDRIHVGAQRCIKRREELHQPRAVEDEANVVGPAVGCDPAVGLRRIARPYCDLFAEEVLAALFDDGFERRRRQHLLGKALFGRAVATRPHEHVQVLQPRIAVEQQGQQNLTQEAVAAGQQDFVLLECGCDVNQADCLREKSAPSTPRLRRPADRSSQPIELRGRRRRFGTPRGPNGAGFVPESA